MKKLPYREGDVFAVPLRSGAFCLGVVARTPRRGKVLLGYFFARMFPSPPSSSDLPPLLPQDALKVGRLGDLSLMTGEWPVVGHLPDWNRDDWPMPKFIRRAPFIGARLVSYANDDPNEEVAEEPCNSEVEGYEEDGLMGAGFVEKRLTKLLVGSTAEPGSPSSRAISRVRSSMGGAMGAWGCGSFENDDAADWVYELKSSGVTAITSALEHVSSLAEDEYLEAPEASAAIAAAEIVAAALDGDLSKLSEIAREAFARHRESLIASDLSESARRAVARVRRRSELKELWEESEEGEIWSRGVDSLSLRLR